MTAPIPYKPEDLQGLAKTFDKRLDEALTELLGAINSNPKTSNYIFDEDETAIASFRAKLMSAHLKALKEAKDL